MKQSPLQLAKREVHDFFGTRGLWIGTLAVGVLLGIAGPFGTDDVMRLIPRVLYWTSIAVMTFLTGSIIDAVLRPPLAQRLAVWLTIPLIAAVTTLCITTQIWLLNAAIFAHNPGWPGVLALGANVYAASVVIATAATLIGDKPAETPAGKAPPPTGPTLIDRLPLGKRGALISLSAVDHYVEVTTTQGTELLLMRLSDAIAETSPIAGLQIHRSHWIATEHAVDVRRASGKATVTVSDGRTLPISRSNLPQLKELGLLPT